MIILYVYTIGLNNINYDIYWVVNVEHIYK